MPKLLYEGSDLQVIFAKKIKNCYDQWIEWEGEELSTCWEFS